ncbi:unnamed protein product [Leptosia nina]|uniref:DUF4219 domain-containing protein n=1 Tax=Leptosia nina TaxID=320188 RepID=A0AAV1JWN8_9NEOP
MATNIRVEPLTRDNYDTWRDKMAQALLTKCGLWDHVCKRNPTQVSPEEIIKYNEKGSLALSELLLIIAPSEVKQVTSYGQLENIYETKGPARKATLLKELLLRKMLDGDNIIDHPNKCMNNVDKLGDMGIEINNDLLSIMLLYSLPQSFDFFFNVSNEQITRRCT